MLQKKYFCFEEAEAIAPLLSKINFEDEIAESCLGCFLNEKNIKKMRNYTSRTKQINYQLQLLCRYLLFHQPRF